MNYPRSLSFFITRGSMLALLLILTGLLWPGISTQSNTIYAQKSFGVHWKVPDDNQEAIKQLKAFHNWGIRYLLLDTKLRRPLLNFADSLNYNIFVSIPNKYTTDAQLNRQATNIVQNLRDYGTYYQDVDHVEAIGLFHYAQFGKKNFREQTHPLVDDFKKAFGKPVYYSTTRLQYQDTLSGYDFFLYKTDQLDTLNLNPSYTQQPAAVLISPPLDVYSLREFQNLISSPILDQQTPLFIESSWLLAHTNNQPELASVIRTFATEKEPMVSTPQPKQESEDSQWLVLVLIGLWASFAIHYAIAPTYRKTLFRYFTVHRFFVNDILERRLRSVSPGIIILLQQALMGGLFFYLLSSALFSNFGLDAIYWHFPILSYLGKTRFIFFVIGILFMLITQVIYLMWLYLLNKDVKFFNQAVILYSWPHQLNLITVTLMVTFYFSDNISTTFYVISVIFGLIWFMSFYIAAGDLSHQIRHNRMLYITHTTGLHTIILILLFIFLYSYSALPDILRLATSLP